MYKLLNLPITKEDYDKLEFKDYSVFESDDKSWKTIFPALAFELDIYNAATKEAAKSVNAKTNTEKFIGYKYDSALGQLLSKVLPKKESCCECCWHRQLLIWKREQPSMAGTPGWPWWSPGISI